MTDAANIWGFSLVAALLGTAVGTFWPTRRRRLTVAALVAAVASLPILPDGVSLTSCVFAFGDVPALTGAATAIYCGLWRRRAAELKSAPATATAFNVGTDVGSDSDAAFVSGSRRETTLVVGALILWGAALYASELNVFAFDFYRLGYASGVGLTVACVAAAFASRRLAALCVGAYVATAAGLYANFFDAILDFGFWAFLTVAAILTGVRNAASRRESSPSFVEEKEKKFVETAPRSRTRLSLRKR